MVTLTKNRSNEHIEIVWKSHNNKAFQKVVKVIHDGGLLF